MNVISSEIIMVAIAVHDDRWALGAAAAAEGVAAIRAAIEVKGSATIIVATGASQFAMLDALTEASVDWSRVRAFHLDEYVGLSETHPASFRGYLRTRFVDKVGNLGEFVAVGGDAADLDAELARLGHRISHETVDVCFAGIGENCHLAFNDPPADFVTDAPYLLVDLDEDCRRQQLGEGWFADLEAVPTRAISMSIREIMRARKLVLTVPDARKAWAVRHAVGGEVSPHYPASIVQRHPDASLHLEPDSAAELAARTA